MATTTLLGLILAAGGTTGLCWLYRHPRPQRIAGRGLPHRPITGAHQSHIRIITKKET